MKLMRGQGRWLEAGAIHDASNQGRSILRSLSQHALERDQRRLWHRNSIPANVNDVKNGDEFVCKSKQALPAKFKPIAWPILIDFSRITSATLDRMQGKWEEVCNAAVDDNLSGLIHATLTVRIAWELANSGHIEFDRSVESLAQMISKIGKRTMTDISKTFVSVVIPAGHSLPGTLVRALGNAARGISGNRVQLQSNAQLSIVPDSFQNLTTNRASLENRLEERANWCVVNLSSAGLI